MSLPPMASCFVCLKITSNRCTECKSVYYCTLECQQADSKRHHKECETLKYEYYRQTLQIKDEDELFKMQRTIKKMSVYEIQKELKMLGLSIKGRLSTLQQRYYSVFKENEIPKNIDLKQDKLTIYGYIRKLYKSKTAIPSEIGTLCLLFYQDFDEFDRETTKSALGVFSIGNNNKRNNCIERMSEYNTMYSSGFGRYIVERGHKIKWRLRINKNNNPNKKIYCAVGIIMNGMESIASYPEYSLVLSEGKMYRNDKCIDKSEPGDPRSINKPLKANDIILMTLDMYLGTLTFIVNGNCESKFLIENIDTTASYKLMVSMMNPKEQIELLE